MRLFHVSLQQFPTCCEKRRSLSPWLPYFILAMWFNHADNFKTHITIEIQTSCKDISKEITISKTFWTKWLAIRLVERIQQFLPERSFRKDLLATNVFPAHHFRRTIDLQRLRLNLSELSPQACASTIMRSQSKMVCNPWTNDPSLRWRSSEGDHRWCLIHRETVSNGEGSGILKTSSNCQLNLSIGLRIDCSLAVDRKTRPETNDFDAFLLAEAGLMPMMTMTWILFILTKTETSSPLRTAPTKSSESLIVVVRWKAEKLRRLEQLCLVHRGTVASSRTTNLDCRNTARAMATICLCPTERFCPQHRKVVRQPSWPKVWCMHPPIAG